MEKTKESFFYKRQILLQDVISAADHCCAAEYCGLQC